MGQTSTKPYRPFTQEIGAATSETADLLDEVIPPMGAPGPQNRPGAPIIRDPVAVEEQYAPAERRTFPTTTTPAYYDIVTQNPKIILIIAKTVDHFVDFNQQITSDSPTVFASATMTITSRNVTRIWYQAVTGTGIIQFLIFSR